jgi:hypothetical protein
MNHYVGIDVSLETSSVCVVDGSGKIVREGKIVSEPDALIAWLGGLKLELTRIGLEAGPLSQWLYAAMRRRSPACRPGVMRAKRPPSFSWPARHLAMPLRPMIAVETSNTQQICERLRGRRADTLRELWNTASK